MQERPPRKRKLTTQDIQAELDKNAQPTNNSKVENKEETIDAILQTVNNAATIINSSNFDAALFNKVKRILIVEDQSILQKTIQKVFKQIFPDAELVLVNNGKEAVEAFKTVMTASPPNPFDFIVMDFQSNAYDMLGDKATQTIRDIEKAKDYQHTPILTWSDSYVRLNVATGKNEPVPFPGSDMSLPKPLPIGIDSPELKRKLTTKELLVAGTDLKILLANLEQIKDRTFTMPKLTISDPLPSLDSNQSALADPNTTQKSNVTESRDSNAKRQKL